MYPLYYRGQKIGGWKAGRREKRREKVYLGSLPDGGREVKGAAGSSRRFAYATFALPAAPLNWYLALPLIPPLVAQLGACGVIV